VKKVRSRGCDTPTAVCWKDKRVVYILLGVHETEAHGRIQVELGNVLKPKAMNNCNKHMGSVDKSDRMADSYRLSCRLGGNGQKSCFLFD